MKKFLIQFFLLIALITAAIVIYQKGNAVEIPFIPQLPKMITLQINDSIIRAEVAETSSQRSKGLGGREQMASDSGMLFVFEKSDKHAFWMKELKFPLDFIWIKDDLVADVLENIPQPAQNEPDSSLQIYSSKSAVNKVLEVNAGTVKRLNIKSGDRVLVK